MSLRYAVIGNPIKHSKSPQIHTAFAKQESVELSYEKILAAEDKFTDEVNDFYQQGGLGLNVTVPFKIAAYQQCHQLSQEAQKAKAVNTIHFNNKGEWLGANTDGIGLLKDLTLNLKCSLEDKRILVLGAGGATQGILLPLLNAKPHSLVIANRTVSKAQQLANDFSSHGNILACGFNDLEDQSFDLILKLY